jgi:autotransporter-associated beta strand protein
MAMISMSLLPCMVCLLYATSRRASPDTRLEGTLPDRAPERCGKSRRSAQPRDEFYHTCARGHAGPGRHGPAGATRVIGLAISGAKARRFCYLGPGRIAAMVRRSGWLSRAAGAVLAALLVTGAARAQFSWSGDNNTLFINPLNWLGLNPPFPFPASVGGQDIIFDTGPGLWEPGNANIATIDGFSYVDVGFLRFKDTNGDVIAFLIQQVDLNLIGTGDRMFLIDGGQLVVWRNIDLSHTGGVQLVAGGAGETSIVGVISGAGATLLKVDPGTLILFGANTYTGGTELAEGTLLIVGNSALGTGVLLVTGDSGLGAAGAASAANDIFLAAELTILGDDNLALNGTIQGSGSLVMDFDGDDDVLVLSGDNSYTGGTTLTQGLLVLGHENAVGTGAITVTGDSGLGPAAPLTLDNAISIDDTVTLTIFGVNDFELAGTISGDGALGMDFDADDDVLTLSGNNTYTGGTILTRGTLLLASDTALGDVTGLVTIAGDATIQSDADRVVDNDIAIGNVSTLTFSGASSLTLNGDISGLGGSLAVDLDDGRTLRLTGDGTYTGPTSVDGGELRLDGASLLSAVTVNNGAIVSGNGSMTDLTLALGGTYRAVIDSDAGTADLLDLTGAATLAAGSTIEGSLTGTTYIPGGQTFDIINAAGGITDNGAAIVTSSATVTVNLIRDEDFINGDTSYALELARAADAYSAPTDPGNDRAIGLSLDSLIPVADGDPTGPAGDLLGALDGLDAQTYGAAVSQLSPEPYNVSTGIWRDETRQYMRQQTEYLATVRHTGEAATAPRPGPPAGALALAHDDPLVLAAAIAQAEEAPVPRAYAWEDRWGGYAEAQGIFVDRDSTSNRTGYTVDSAGLQVGLDYTFSQGLLVGVALGYLWADADLDRSLGEIDQDTLRIGPYLSWFEHAWYVNVSATFGYSWIDGEREIPALGLTADSDYDAYDFTGYVGTGYQFELKENLVLTPIASLLYSHIEFDSFTETGAGGANLTVPSRDEDSLRSRLGANLSYRFADLGAQPITYVYAGWEHEFEDDGDLEASFRAGGNPFIIDTGSRDDDAVFVGAGVEALVYESMAAYFRLEYVGSDSSDALGIAGGITFAF